MKTLTFQFVKVNWIFILRESQEMVFYGLEHGSGNVEGEHPLFIIVNLKFSVLGQKLVHVFLL